MRPEFYEDTRCDSLTIWKKWKLSRTYLLALILLCGAVDVRGQVPKMFSFQGIARDASGKIVANKSILVEVNIVNPDDGQAVYGETYQPTTNSQGIFTIAVGDIGLSAGNAGDMSAKDWIHKNFSLRLFLNIEGIGGQYVELESEPLLSVPYAFVSDHSAFAEKAGSVNSLTHDLPIIQTGTASGPALSTVGVGNKLIWYPKKASFRVGQITGNQWEEAQIGDNSFAAGLDVLASGAQSIALGNGTTANALNGIALGKYNDIPTTDLFGSPQGRLLQVGNGGGPGSRSNALTILNSGKVGIGGAVLVPEHLLDLGGRARIRHSANQTAGIFLDGPLTKESSFVGMKADNEVGFFIGGDWRFWVNGQGNGYLNGNIIQTSDRRLKRNFSPVTNSLSKLTNLTGQHYFWKDTTKSQELQTGLVAQEVEQYFPELVTTDDKGFKAVNYIGLIPHLIESVKLIGVLEKKLESFTAREDQMQKEVANVIRDLRSELSIIKAANNSNQQSK